MTYLLRKARLAALILTGSAIAGAGRSQTAGTADSVTALPPGSTAAAITDPLKAIPSAASPGTVLLPEPISMIGSPVPPPGSAPLTLEQCVAEALEKNFAVKIEHFTIDEAVDSVIIAKAGFEPTFNYTGRRTVTQDPLASDSSNIINGIQATHLNNEESVFSVSEPIVTGATISGNYSLLRQYSNPAINFPNPSYGGNTSITVVQPLLQGAGVAYNKALIDSARVGVRIANLNFKSTVLTTVYNIETAYFNLLYARERFKVQQDTLKLAQELYDENVVKRQTGVLTDLDVMQARVGVATALNQVILDEQAVHNSEDLLLQGLGDRNISASVGNVIFPETGEPQISFDRSYKLARDKGPSLAIVEATIEQYKLAALRAKGNALPSLNVTGGFGYASSAHSDYQANFGAWNGYNWTAGLAVSVPWGMHAANAQYHQALTTIRSEQATLDQTDQNLIVQVRAAVRAVQTNVASLRASTEQTLYASRQYDLQKAEFDAGLATSFDVLQAQNNLETARVSELQAKVGLLSAIADLRFLEGTSLDLYRIHIPE